MITWLGGIIGEKTARILPYVAIPLLVIAAFGLGRCDGANRERDRIELERAKANQEAEKRNSDAKEKASEQRAQDTADIGQKQKDQLDAIEGSNDVRRDAACERLRASRGIKDAIAAGCRFAE